MPGVRARVFHRQPRLVGELAEVDLPGMARAAQHEDVRAGAEDPLLQAGDDDGLHFGMLEANALDRVGQLDVHAEVVRVQLQPVVRAAGRASSWTSIDSVAIGPSNASFQCR